MHLSHRLQHFWKALLLLTPGALLAQSQAIDGNIEGYVRAHDGSTIHQARVRAANQDTGLIKDTLSAEDGHYLIQLLPPGIYTVTVAKEGFQVTVRPEVGLKAGQVATVDLQLRLGDVTTVVEVKEEMPAVESARTSAYSNVYTAREARSIPVAGRSILDFFVVNPIVNAPPLSTGGSGTGTPSASYGGLGFRQINVDGVSNNLQGGARNLVISQDAIGEFQTATNYPAEFGRQAALLMNSFSRSGSNDWHGSAYLFTRQKVLSSRPYLLASTAPTPEFFRYNWGATASGPIRKDKAFFFVSYERWLQDLPVVSTFGGSDQAAIVNRIGGIPPSSVGTYTTTFRAHTLTAKGDWTLSDRNRLSLRYNYYRDRESVLNGGQQTREVGSGYTENPMSGTFQLVTSLRSNLLNELRFLYIKRDIENAPINSLTPRVTISGIGSFNGNQDGTFRSYESGYQLIDNVTWNTGRHSVKFGLELLPAGFEERTRNLNGTFTFSGLAALNGRPAVSPLDQYYFASAGTVDPATGRPYSYSQFARALGKEFYTATVINQGYFLQDDIRLNSRLKLNVGLRYELFLRPEGNRNPAYPATGVIPQDYNNVAPRVSIAWDPDGKGKAVIRAGYGIYYNTTVAQTFNTFLRGNGVAVQNITVTPDQQGAPAFTRSALPAFSAGTVAISNLNVFDSRFEDPKVHSYFVTFERELFRDHTVSVSYLGNQARNLPYAIPGNLVETGVLADGRPQYGGTRTVADARFGVINRTVSEGYQSYNGLLVTMTRRLSHGLSLQAGYQYQNVHGLSFVNSFTAFGATTTPSNPADPKFDEGTGDFSQPHRFTVTAVWNVQLPVQGTAARVLNGWMLSTRTIAQSGMPYSPTTGQDNNGDTVFNDRPAGVRYNSYRLPNYIEVDVRATRNFRVTERSNLELMAEAFNLPNRLNVTGVNTTWGAAAAPNSTFRRATSAETARQFQLGARYSF